MGRVSGAISYNGMRVCDVALAIWVKRSVTVYTLLCDVLILRLIVFLCLFSNRQNEAAFFFRVFHSVVCICF